MLSLVTDAFGGRGGIAQYNRHFLTALAFHPDVDLVVALPRVAVEAFGEIPPKIRYEKGATRGKVAFVLRYLRTLVGDRFDLVVCAHIHLLPLAILAAWRHRAPAVLLIYGIEAWTPRQMWTYALLRRLTAVITISQFTATRFLQWSRVPPERVRLLPCCIEASAFGPGPKDEAILARYGLAGRTVLLTVARLAGSERYKGLDQVIEALPRLARDYPMVSYLVAGEGPDQRRLEQKAALLGVLDRVVFTGYIPEETKASHYRLADAFVMPGRGEGFGIVFLEAMASGLPVLGSSLDASAEVLRGGELGPIVDPDDPEDVLQGLRTVLSSVPPDTTNHLNSHSVSEYRHRCHEIISAVIDGRTPRDGCGARSRSAS